MPVHDLISMKNLHAFANNKVFVTDIAGKLVDEIIIESNDSGSHVWNCSHLSNGMYFIHASNAKIKFLKE